MNVIQTTDTSDLVKKAGYNTKIDEIEKAYLAMINIRKFNKLTADKFGAKLKQVKLATEDDIADLVRK